MSSRAAATRSLPIAAISTSRSYLQENPYTQYDRLQQLPQPLAAQYAASAAPAALTPAYGEEQGNAFYLGIDGAGFAADGVLGGSPGACSDDLLFGPGSMPGGHSLAGTSPTGDSLTAAAYCSRSWAQLQGDSYGNSSMSSLPTSSMGAAATAWVKSKALEQQQQQMRQHHQVQPAQALAGLVGSIRGSVDNQLYSSSMMQQGQWAACAPLPAPALPPPPRQTVRRVASQVMQSASSNGLCYMQQLGTASDQILGSSYQQQQMQQARLAESVACGLGAEFNAGAFSAGGSFFSSESTSSGVVAGSSGLDLTGQQQQQQQHAGRLQGRSNSSDSLLPLRTWSTDEQLLHSQIGCSSSSVALQPLMRSSSSSHELQAVHAINAQLEQLLKLKEEVLAAKASVQAVHMPAAAAAAAAAACPLPATAPMLSPAAMLLPASTAGMLPALSRMHSVPEQRQHDQQQLFWCSDMQPQLLGTSLGSAGVATPSSFQLGAGTQAGAQPGATSDMLPPCRRSSNGSSVTADPRHVAGCCAGDGRGSGQLAALEQARQQHAVRAVTEQKLQQLAAVQRMQLDLQQELLQMLAVDGQ